MACILSVFVPGTPVAKGSTHSFLHKTTQRIITLQTNAAKQRPWASLIALSAKGAMAGGPVGGPVSVHMDFRMPRPKNHHRTGKFAAMLRPDAPTWHTKAPDLDKLVRCVFDALTGIVFHDDAQVCCHGALKVYGGGEGVHITVSEPEREATE
jgi:Holliday junction resolvase RusA-like endonuclease